MALLRVWTLPALALLCLVLHAGGSQPVRRCRGGGDCGCVLHKSIRLTRLMAKLAQDLRTTYMSSQGDFSETFCTLPLKEVPRAEITGSGTLERLRNIHTTLGLFLQHVAVVTEEQGNLQDSRSPLLKELQDAQAHLSNLAASISKLLQYLHPNDPPVVTRLERDSSPARNTFQQKIYGCAVLTNHRDFLSHVLQELKDLKATGHTCLRRRKRWLGGVEPTTS